MARGINGADIFVDDADRRYFLDQLTISLEKTGYRCYGWALLSNHFHLVVRCSERPTGDLMRALNSRYAKYFNAKHRRHGYLFQDRFKSILSQDQHYLEELIRYVHLNPIRAGLCGTLKELDTYQWCGHGVIMGKTLHAFQTTDTVFRRFGSSDAPGRRRYRKFIEEGLRSVTSEWAVEAVRASNQGIDKKDKPECWVIGDRKFVLSVMEKNEQRLKGRTVLRQKWPLKAVVQWIAAEHNIAPEDLKNRGRLSTVSEAKKQCAFLCCRILGYSNEDVAGHLNISGPAVSWLIKKGEETMRKRDVDKFINLPPG